MEAASQIISKVAHNLCFHERLFVNHSVRPFSRKMSDFFCSVVFVSLGRVIQHTLDKPAHGPFLADFTCMFTCRQAFANGFTDELLHTLDDVVAGGKWLAVESPLAIFCLCLPSIFALVKRGIDDGPRGLFPFTRPLSVQSYADRVTMLRQASDDGGVFDNTNLYALAPRAPGLGVASNTTASGGKSSSDGSNKTTTVTVRDPNVIHIQTEISVETRSTWGDLLGVDI